MPKGELKMNLNKSLFLFFLIILLFIQNCSTCINCSDKKMSAAECALLAIAGESKSTGNPEDIKAATNLFFLECTSSKE
ncbi:hypothetical protein CH365_12355 [Leptospira neocaledonica]|uniref:Uncharacterized protein n=1 Tax=Leptospira neocaledonica TaxID=2023192 RepID=A0A2M9ZXL7_9LEPT|nr:hypothetical protein CH365_12355 [Leptospira neocaledonica]